METIKDTILGMLPSIALLLAGLVVIKVLLRILGRALEKSKLEKTAHPLIRTVAKWALYVLLLLMVASGLGIDVTGLVAITGVVSLAVSLAMQDAIGNIIAGFTLLTTHPFLAGDFVEVAGQNGTVMAIGFNYTVLSTGDNKTVSIPNSAVVSAQIVNYTSAGTRRVDIEVSASYDADTEIVKQALLRSGEVQQVLDSPAPFVGLKTYGDHAITYILRLWCKSEDYWTVYYTVNERIRSEFADAGIEMTYPHLNVHLDK